MTKLAEAERDAFLSNTRLGILNTVNAEGFPIGVPVWFDWDGEVERIFTVATSQKVQRIEADSRASLLVVNDLSELERWVSFDGNVTVVEQGGIELAEKLAGRYWDLRDPAKKERSRPGAKPRMPCVCSSFARSGLGRTRIERARIHTREHAT